MLLLSNKIQNTGYLEHTLPWLQNFLTDYRGKTICFIALCWGTPRAMNVRKNCAKCTFWFKGWILFPFIMVNSIEILMNKRISSLLAAGIHFVCSTLWTQFDWYHSWKNWITVRLILVGFELWGKCSWCIHYDN